MVDNLAAFGLAYVFVKFFVGVLQEVKQVGVVLVHDRPGFLKILICILVMSSSIALLLIIIGKYMHHAKTILYPARNVFFCSCVPRPLPVLLCVTLKNWEWPRDEAMCIYMHVEEYATYKITYYAYLRFEYSILFSLLLSLSIAQLRLRLASF